MTGIGHSQRNDAPQFRKPMSRPPNPEMRRDRYRLQTSGFLASFFASLRLGVKFFPF
jgi:hypothetical protein